MVNNCELHFDLKVEGKKIIKKQNKRFPIGFLKNMMKNMNIFMMKYEKYENMIRWLGSS